MFFLLQLFVCLFACFFFLNSKVESFLQEFHELISVALMISTVVAIICEKGKEARLESFLANCKVKKLSEVKRRQRPFLLYLIKTHLLGRSHCKAISGL